MGLPDGAVSSPSSTGTPTTTRPPGPEIGRDRSLPVWTSPAVPSQARVGSLGKTAVPRSSDDCPGVHLNAWFLTGSSVTVPSPSRPHSPQG